MRSKKWPGLQPFWRAKKILGHGTFGICGLWSNSRETRDSLNFPEHIVIKQAREGQLVHESQFLRVLRYASFSN